MTGGGVLVSWRPDEKKRKIDRIQSNNAQYQIFRGLDDITLSNIKFEYIPADILGHTDAWSGTRDWTEDQIRNAEFQFLNEGNVTLKNCTFEKVIASPFGDQQNRPGDANRSLTVTDCTFSNVYNAYALKDIYPANAVIKDNHFENCSGAIYFEGTIPRGTIAISENQFGNIDQYAAAGKENTRGIIQLSAGFTTATSTQIILKDNTITGNLVKDENVTGGIGRSKADCQSRWQGDRRLDTRQGVFDQGGGSIHIALHAGWDGWKNQLPICWLGRKRTIIWVRRISPTNLVF